MPSPRYLERAGEPKQPADLAQHECLRFHGPKADTPTLHRGGESTEITVMGRFRVNSMGMLERLARHEQGVAVLAGPLVAEAVAAGQLQRVLPQ